MLSTALAHALCVSPAAHAADEAVEEEVVEPTEPSQAPAPPAGGTGFGSKSLFQLPPQDGTTGVPSQHGAPPRPVTQFLKYQYSFGSESDVTYRRDTDLDKRLRDNSLVMAPQLNGYIIYRPTEWTEMMLEVILERELAVIEEKSVTLPGGEIQPAERRQTSLVVDQAWLRFKGIGPLTVTAGRLNFEDDRHWLYDTSLDVAHVRFKEGAFSAEFSFGRKDLLGLDAFRTVKRTPTDNYILYLDYRGIEDVKLGGYAILRDDRTGKEGRPLHLGVRASAKPSDRFNYWAELGALRGTDASSKKFAARGYDVGATYRFPDLPLDPSITLAYAAATGDDNPRDDKNTEFRQTGLQSNEQKFSGVSKFKYYGEVLDPELSNVEIFTVGIGFRPVQNVFVDLVYHRYRLVKLADSIRNSALTAQMNQDDTNLSKDVGSALDIVVGVRNLFGVRRLGVDIRAGVFFPGHAFRNDVSADPDNPLFRKADRGILVLAKFWW